MASPGQSTLFNVFTELVSTTYRKHYKEVADNVSTHNALWRRLNDKGRVRLEDGGLSIVTPLEYATNTTFQRYSGFDTLNIQAVDVISAAEFAWKQAAENVAISGLEMRTNSGESRIINFVKAKVKNAQHSFKNNMSSDIYSDGTASNQIGGMQALVSDLGTGTVGGINSTTFTFWKSILQSAAAPLQGGGAITASATTIESLMLPLWIKLTRGTDMPDLIVMDPVYFAYFEQSQTSLKRYAPSDDGKGGMISMKYKTADVFFDAATLIPASHAYFLNTDYLELVVHKDANMTMMDDLRSINQDAIVIPILWMGNLVVSNRSLQGVIKA
jgi:hypothetical protein